MIPVGAHRCTKWARPQKVLYFAQSGKAARTKFVEEHMPIITAAWPEARTRLSNGSEAVTFPNRSSWTFEPPTETAGHGSTVDLGFVD
jgi:hypothetical protein